MDLLANLQEANSKITELQGLIVEKTNALAEFENLKANNQELTNKLAEADAKIIDFEKAKTDLEAAKADLENKINALTEDHAKALADFDSKVAAKAVEISAAQGIPPVASVSTPEAVDPIKTLKGLQKVEAVFKNKNQKI